MKKDFSSKITIPDPYDFGMNTDVDGEWSWAEIRSDQIITVNEDVTVDLWLIAAGGDMTSDRDAGGGGGGGIVIRSGLFIPANNHTVNIGMAVVDNIGEDSTFFGLTAIGGGLGQFRNGTDGGSGAGGGNGRVGSSALQPYSTDGGLGHDGGDGIESFAGGGGGGAGASGNNGSSSAGGRGGQGGAPALCTLTGVDRWFSPGGCGGGTAAPPPEITNYGDLGSGGSSASGRTSVQGGLIIRWQNI